MLDRREDRARPTGSRLFIPEVRIQLIELAHLAVGSPTQIAVPGAPQIRMGDFLETTRRVEARGEVIGKRLIVDKAVCLCREDRLFVKMLSVDCAAFYSCDFRAHQCGPVFEVLWAILRPYFELPLVSCQSLEMPLSLVGSCGVPGCRMGKRTVEVKLCRFEL